MLVDLVFKPNPADDPLLALLAAIGEPKQDIERIQQGVYLNYCWNLEYMVEPGQIASESPIMSPGTARWLLDFQRRIKAGEVEEPRHWKYFADIEVIPAPKTIQKLYAQKPPKKYLGSYGVCDSPEQLLSYYDFEADPRHLTISLVEIKREDQPERDGWRYHKWGEYIGRQRPQHEYLYDDKHIDRVFTYHIYRITGA